MLEYIIFSSVSDVPILKLCYDNAFNWTTTDKSIDRTLFCTRTPQSEGLHIYD